jgi:[ribosomal protein S5]-alanine N-acetyltransferase
MANSSPDPPTENAAPNPQPSNSISQAASRLQLRLQCLSIDPEKGHTSLRIYPEDMQEVKEFLQFTNNRRKWIAWRQEEWRKKQPPYIAAVFENFPTLQTPRLSLRQLRRDDDQDAFHALSQQINIQYYGCNIPYAGVEQTRQDFIDVHLDRYKFRHSLTFVITFTGVDKYIGHIIAVLLPETGFKIVELSYLIEHEYWNKGIGTEAIGRVIELLLDELKVHKIRANCFEKNVASKRVLEKLGFEQEGLLKDDVVIDGEYQAEYCMAKFSSLKNGE